MQYLAYGMASELSQTVPSLKRKSNHYLVDAKDLDEAIALAARIPAARHGSVEVRPVFVMEQAART